MCIVLFGNPLSIENQLTIEPLEINPKAYGLAEREFRHKGLHSLLNRNFLNK